MATDPRDTLWKYSFDTYYDAYFEELLADSLIKRWMRIDFGVKIIVALTASGSAVAGLTLWNEPGLKAVWAAISLIAAVGSIFHTTVQAANLIKEHTKSNADFASLRNGLEDFRRDLNIHPQFDVDSKNAEFDKLRKKYDECSRNTPRDWTVTDRFRIRIKNILNDAIRDQIRT
jgi:hypothetical protein